MKKILAIVLAAMMLLGCAVFASAAETALPDVTFAGWWSAHSQGVEITEEGFTLTFFADTEDGAAANYCTPSLVVHAGSAEVLGTEYWVQRADAWGWLYAENIGDNAAALNEKGYTWNYTFAEGFTWENFQAATEAGTEATVTAKLEGNVAVITYVIAGVTNQVNIPVDTANPVFLCLTGERCAVSNMVVTTPEAEVEAPIADGDNVKIFFPKNESYISATANDNGKKLLEANEAEAAVFSVEVDENGYYTFICDGKYLTSGATGNSLTLADAPSEFSLWTLEAAENGWFLKNVNAAYNGNPQYLEFYSGFTTYGKSATADVTIYTFQFVKVENSAPVPPTGDAIFAVLAVMSAAALGLTAVVSKKR